MPTDKKTLYIPLDSMNAGIDQKFNPNAGYIKNGIFKRGAAISKRTGWEDIGDAVVDGYMAQFSNAPVVYGENLEVLSNADTWIRSTNDVGMMEVAVSDIATRKANLWFHGDICIGTNVFAISYTTYDIDNDSYGAHVESFDKNSGLRLDGYEINTSSAVRHTRVESVRSDLLKWYYMNDDGDIALGDIDTDDGTITFGELVSGNVAQSSTYRTFDTCVLERNGSSTYVILVYIDTGGDIQYISLPLGVGTSSLKTTISASNTAIKAVSVWRQSADNATCAWIDTTGSVETIEANTRDYAGTNVGGPDATNSWNSSAFLAFSITGVASDDTNSRVYVSRESTNIPAVPDIIYGSWLGNFFIGATNDFLKRVRLATKAVREEANTFDHKLGIYSTGWEATASAQNDLYFVDEDGNVEGKAKLGNAMTSVADISPLPSFDFVDGKATTLVSYLIRNDNSEDNKDIYHFARIDVSQTHSKNWTSNSMSLNIANSVPYTFDGTSVVETGFHAFPEGVSASTAGVAGAGNIENGTYRYLAVYEWVDAQGRIHESAPAPTPAEVTISGGANNVNVVVPCLSLTRKDPVQIAVYRTLKNTGSQSQYFRLGSFDNDTTAENITYFDAYNDDAISNNNTLYTTVDNIQPFGYTVSTIWKNRHFYVDAENTNRIYYSKEFTASEPINHSDFLVKEIDEDGGAITAMSPLLDKLVVFKKNKIFVLTGIGFDDNALGVNYSHYLVNPNIGCVNQNSVVRIPQGIIFEASNGLWLLDQGLSVNPIGDPVRHYTDTLTIVRGLVRNDIQIAIFLTSSETALIYDWMRDKWSTYDNHVADDGVMINDVLYRLNGSYVYEDWANYFDRDDSVAGDSNIELEIVSGWQSPAGIGESFELKKLKIVGQNLSNHSVTLSVGYDFDAFWSGVSDAFSTSSLQAFDHASYFGDGSADNDDQAYILEYNPERQLCHSFRVKVSIPGSVNDVELNGVIAEIRILPGGIRTDDSRTMGG